MEIHTEIQLEKSQVIAGFGRKRSYQITRIRNYIFLAFQIYNSTIRTSHITVETFLLN